MFDNETLYPWRGAFVEWIGFTLLWGFVWMVPWVILGAWSIDGGIFLYSIGSLGLPFISGYLLFRTVARMITREGESSDGESKKSERITHEEMRAN